MSEFDINYQKAKAVYDPSQKTKSVSILKGSILTIDPAHVPAKNIQANYDFLRKQLSNGNAQKLNNGPIKVLKDFPYVSPSAAKVMVDGKPGSGRTCWVCNGGRKLETLRTGNVTTQRSNPHAAGKKTNMQTSIHKIDNTKLINRLEQLSTDINNDSYSRWTSWDHCYKFFNSHRGKLAGHKNHAALHLGFFLGNWGMFRNSKLLKKNHTLYESIVVLIDQVQYQPLAAPNPLEVTRENHITLISELGLELAAYLNKGGVSPTTTLITKILLATLGCIPAIDIQAQKALAQCGIKVNLSYGLPSGAQLRQLFEFAHHNKKTLQDGAKIVSPKNSATYPLMKVLDAYLWILGDEILTRNSTSKK